jgi:type I restriction enzyme S subunit
MRKEIQSRTDAGTILNALNVRSIPRLRFVCAPTPIHSCFEHLIRPLRERMERNMIESHTLSSLRDTLLPKLISGQIRIKDAERFVAGG